MAFVKTLEIKTAKAKKVSTRTNSRHTAAEQMAIFAQKEIEKSARSKMVYPIETAEKIEFPTADILANFPPDLVKTGVAISLSKGITSKPYSKIHTSIRAELRAKLNRGEETALKQQQVISSSTPGLHRDDRATATDKTQEKVLKRNRKRLAASKTLPTEEVSRAEESRIEISRIEVSRIEGSLPLASSPQAIVETFIAENIIIEEVMPQIEAKMSDLTEAEKIAADKISNTAKTAKGAPASKHGFKQSEFIVYPAHGVGQIIAIEEQEVAGFKLELFVISFVKDKMILKVPTPKAVSVRMRKLADAAIVKKSLDTLTGRARIKRTMWSRRAQEYEAKINSGDLIAIAEVVRDLYRSNAQPEQSYSERQLYEAALDRMAREIAVVQKFTEAEAFKLLDAQLQKGPRRGKGEEIEIDEADVDEDGNIEEAA
jgi:CarD family transcriptional regulator